ncbi:ATPase, T2SS/T4P/T4SS family [Enterococcus faecium]|uniref:ATPase, T2SS/T4P/T4SS family n=3 Tax=Enterococcus TaxID=1350 RepID=UPI0038D36F21
MLKKIKIVKNNKKVTDRQEESNSNEKESNEIVESIDSIKKESDEIEQEKELIAEISDYMNQYYPCLKLESLVSDEAKEEMKEIVAEVLIQRRGLTNSELVDKIVSESVGLGIIENVLKDPTITDISYNGTELILETNDRKWRYEEEVTGDYISNLISRLANIAKKEFNDKEPILDMQLKRLRINAVHKSLNEGNASLSIRISRNELVLSEDNFSSLAPIEVLLLLVSLVKSHCNIVIAGETGAGKTVLQQLLMSYISFDERIVLVEDTPEAHAKELFPEKDVICWHSNAKKGVDELIKASLRNNPKWVMVTEIRRATEAYEWLQAILSDHCGITTIHATEAEAIPDRILNMVLEETTVKEDRYLQLIKQYVHIGIQMKVRVIEGKKIRYIQKIVGFRETGNFVTIFSQKCLKDGILVPTFGEIPKEIVDRLVEYGNESEVKLFKANLLEGL